MSRASAFAAQPFRAYTGPRVAGFTPDELAGFQAARGVASASGALAPLTGELVQEGVAASRDLATRLPETDLSGYMSPFTEAVLDPTIRALAERSAQERLRLGQQSARTGSFGGSRQAIAESELERGTQRNIGEETARQRAAAYNSALQQFRLDQERIPALYAGALGQVGAGLQQTAARLGTEVNPLLQIGGAQRALTQAELDFARQQFEEERDFPLRGIEVLRSSLGLPAASLGIGSTGTTTGQQPGPNVLGSVLGGITQAPKFLAGAGALGNFFGLSNPFGGSVAGNPGLDPNFSGNIYGPPNPFSR
jgi:type II secretory pathway pseudopilin PulG